MPFEYYRSAFAALLLAAVIAPAFAAEKVQPAGQTLQARYEHCQSLVDSNAKAALQQAQAWRDEDGSASAMHCQALALVALKRYAEAAGLLATLAGDASIEADMRAQLFDQAGNAWLLAAEPGKALPLLTSALAIAPHNADMLADRARARAMHGDWDGAETDLTYALGGDPERADLLVLRASAYHAMGKKTEALADISHALEILPSYGEALLERGNIKIENGDAAGARADWQAVLTKAPDSSAAPTARAQIAELDAPQQPSKQPAKPAKKH